MTLRELMKAYSMKTGNELRDICKENLLKVRRYFRQGNISDENWGIYNRSIWRLFVSADKRVRPDEYNLFIYTVGYKEEEFSKSDFYEATNHGSDPDFVQWFIRETRKFPTEIRYAVCNIGLCIMGVDEDVSDSEVELLEKLLK